MYIRVETEERNSTVTTKKHNKKNMPWDYQNLTLMEKLSPNIVEEGIYGKDVCDCPSTTFVLGSSKDCEMTASNHGVELSRKSDPKQYIQFDLNRSGCLLLRKNSTK